ncbi:hypothetical protein J2Z37_004154 [Ammoniphilus resinae]|uniref:Uncharacterized protein n=1 Tax=Ammoniphilus resinae TaxID=861532 RepID=A0ABS4GW99_9BACL|nr:hypothetical protein [Ammoniphilus resinae]
MSEKRGWRLMMTVFAFAKCDFGYHNLDDDHFRIRQV